MLCMAGAILNAFGKSSLIGEVEASGGVNSRVEPKRNLKETHSRY
jgi:hypothetical protein